MSTFRELTNEVLSNLQGFSRDQDQVTHLTDPIQDNALTFKVNDARSISQGVIEIEDELIWVQSTDPVNQLVKTIPLGRGYRNTDPIFHPAGSTVINNPRYPRINVKKSINRTLASVYPMLYSIQDTTFPFVSAVVSYELPANAEQIHQVVWEITGPSDMWKSVRRYKFVPDANTTEFPTGKALQILDLVTPGRTVQVTYLSSPGQLVSPDDDFETVSGLSFSAEDCIVYGTCARLISYGENPRLQIHSIESTERAELVPPGSSVEASQYFYALYQQRLAEERSRILKLHPRRVHFTRW